MDTKQLANAYSIAKVMGYSKSIDDFQEEYEKIFKETINELNSRPVKLAKVEAVENPFHTSVAF